MALDLEAYLARIGWTGATPPTLDTLSGLLRAHMAHIPFENLDVLLHRPLRLELDAIQDKLVAGRRGGYCFEQTTLFAAVLDAIGFRPVRHSARVVLFSPRHESPRTHMILTVALPKGTVVLDPGFGGPAADVPVPLVDAGDGLGGSASHWMARVGDEWVLRARGPDGPVDAWVSTLEEDYPVDYEMGSHFMASHPSSPFVNNIMMSIFSADGRVTLMNRDFAIRRAGTTTTGQLGDREAMRAFVAEHFGFDDPAILDLRVPSIPEWT